MNQPTQSHDPWSAPALPDSPVYEVVGDVVAAGRRLGLAVTGGGSRAVTWLLDHPGASAAVAEACIPYDEAALAAYLSGPGPHRVAPETARRLALRARERVISLGLSCDDDIGDVAVGVGCTAALVTSRQRRGADRGHVACRGPERYWVHELAMERGAASRHDQEGALSAALLHAVAAACGQDSQSLPGLPAWAGHESREVPVHAGLEDLLEGRCQALWWRGSAPAAERGLLLVPGSFNPLHRGHLGLLTAAASRSGRAAALELSVANVDKPTLGYEEVLRRVEALPDHLPVVLTRAPTFVEKVRLFPGAWYAIGCDTAARLVDAVYYEGSGLDVDRALDEMARLGAHFVVAGRVCAGRFATVADLALPPGRADLFTGLTESEFRADISSTELRAHAEEST